MHIFDKDGSLHRSAPPSLGYVLVKFVIGCCLGAGAIILASAYFWRA